MHCTDTDTRLLYRDRKAICLLFSWLDHESSVFKPKPDFSTGSIISEMGNVMKTGKRKWLVGIAVLFVALWAFLSGHMVYRAAELQERFAGRACHSLTVIYQTMNNPTLYTGEYQKIRDYEYNDAMRALQDLSLLSDGNYPGIEDYLWECYMLSRQVVDNRLTDEEREAVRVPLMEFAELTYTYSGMDGDSISSVQRLKEIEKTLYEMINVNEESRVAFGEVSETLTFYEHRDDNEQAGEAAE